jgi:hypothetical protein
LAVTDVYTYSGSTVTAGTNLLADRYALAATGNSTVGVFGGGAIGTTPYANTYLYTYIGNTVSVGTNLKVARRLLAACSSTPGWSSTT